MEKNVEHAMSANNKQLMCQEASGDLARPRWVYALIWRLEGQRENHTMNITLDRYPVTGQRVLPENHYIRMFVIILIKSKLVWHI